VRGKVYEGIQWGNLRERVHLEDPGVEGDNVKMYLEVGWGHGLD
jgi:hypothetical protein